MEIRQAEKSEFRVVRTFYHSLIDALAASPWGPGWKKDIYPAPEELERCILAGQLYIGTGENGIMAAMALNRECNEGYRSLAWPSGAGDDEAGVIHILGVHPAFGRRGYARQMVRCAMEIAREQGMKALRLDVLKGNLPAERLYPSLGFVKVKDIKLYYEDTGWMDFVLYEYTL